MVILLSGSDWMARAVSKFICQECGAVLPKWMGQCDVCRGWNCVIEEVVAEEKQQSAVSVPEGFFELISDVAGESHESPTDRHKCTLTELDRVLGGGLVDGSVVLLGGPPGIGKSTLLLQMLSCIGGIENYVYISAEESTKQVMLRANRLEISNKDLMIASSADIHQVLQAIKHLNHNSIVVIDSIQTVSSNLIQSPLGSISQVRFCTQELVKFAKSNGVIVIIVGHITKDGTIAGPKTLEHMVDCVLYFEGERTLDYRIIRCVKNRFGPTDEIGVFSMTGRGLEEVLNPSATFLSEHDGCVSGVAVFSGIEGTRPILSEVQALVSHTTLAIPRRSSVGFDANRLSMIVAVLATRGRINFSNKDVFVNVAGGLKITEPAADLAIAAAIISAAYQKPLPAGSVFFGEIGLSGELRQSHLSFIRMKESVKLGFTDIFCSYKTEAFEDLIGINMLRLKSIRDLVALVRAN
ncbi:MAG: DNA repair protein RadA [Holosporales bacterium]|jgi:DNA repair protein RadA/Sms|nr:DNA repair protein RadA [Holosporales bacterium]